MAEPLSRVQIDLMNHEGRNFIAYSGQFHYRTVRLDRLLGNRDAVTIMKIPHQRGGRYIKPFSL